MLYHYTDKEGYDSIRAQPAWRFKASKPPGENPVGAYFTRLPPDTKNLAKRLRIPKRKVEYYFAFTGEEGLKPISGGRGQEIVYSDADYEVPADRQAASGGTGIT